MSAAQPEQITTADRIRELGAHTTILAAHVLRWQERGAFDLVDGVHPRKALSLAIEDIDGVSRVLLALRSQLISEGRAYDDENNARVDAMLAEHRAARSEASR